jgi:hypothetical protein
MPKPLTTFFRHSPSTPPAPPTTGLSRWLPNHAAALCTMTCGTVTHQAPELLNHHQLSLACDVYSFGIILWELVHPDACAIYGTGLSASPWAVAQHIMAGGRPQFYTQCVPGGSLWFGKGCGEREGGKEGRPQLYMQRVPGGCMGCRMGGGGKGGGEGKGRVEGGGGAVLHAVRAR